MRLTLALVALLACSCSLVAPKNETRLTDYDGGGMWGAFTGGFKGVRLIGEGNVTGCLKYKTDKADYQSAECVNVPPVTTTTTIVTTPLVVTGDE